MTGALYTSAPSTHTAPGSASTLSEAAWSEALPTTTAAERVTASATTALTDDGPLGIADVTREYGLTAVYERIAHLRAAGQRHAALAIERELAHLGAEYPKAV